MQFYLRPRCAALLCEESMATSRRRTTAAAAAVILRMNVKLITVGRDYN